MAGRKNAVNPRTSKGRLLFIHWHESEAAELAAPLAKDWDVLVVHWGEMMKLSELRENPPSAIVISLRRLPSHGRHTAEVFQQTKWAREIPVIFFDGAPEKVAPLKKQFPQATFMTYDNLHSTIERS